MSLWQVRESSRLQETDTALKVGMMLADQLTYAKTCDLQNVKIAIEKNRMKDFFFADVQLRGEYRDMRKRGLRSMVLRLRWRMVTRS